MFELKHYQGLKLRTIARDAFDDGRDGEEHAVSGDEEAAGEAGGCAVVAGIRD